MPGIETGLVVCKANTLPARLSLQPQYTNFIALLPVRLGCVFLCLWSLPALLSLSEEREDGPSLSWLLFPYMIDRVGSEKF